MNAFEKAVARIESIAAEEGGYPEQITIALYLSEASFHRVHPGEDYADHKRQREAIVAWCEKKDIYVVDLLVTRDIGSESAAVAKRISRPPYRLGISMGQGSGFGSVGFMALELGIPGKKNKGGVD